MAQHGTDLEVLLVFSGHKSVDMLLRYLGRGKAAGKRRKQGRKAAKALNRRPKG
jgi:uncharacterized small protein (DUF1192 family)